MRSANALFLSLSLSLCLSALSLSLSVSLCSLSLSHSLFLFLPLSVLSLCSLCALSVLSLCSLCLSLSLSLSLSPSPSASASPSQTMLKPLLPKKPWYANQPSKSALLFSFSEVPRKHVSLGLSIKSLAAQVLHPMEFLYMKALSCNLRKV